MSQRRCCCDSGSDRCSCPSNEDQFNGLSCNCTTYDCDSPPTALAACCDKVWTITASMDGLLYSPDSYSVFGAADSISLATIADTWFPSAPPSCSYCSGFCTAGITSNDLVTYQSVSPCATPGSTLVRFVASPSACTSSGRIVAERYAPTTCFDSNGCWVDPYMQKYVPTRFHGTYSATFKWAVKSGNTRTPTVCTLPGVYVTNANVGKLTATSDCGMGLSSFDIVCTTVNGVAYFIITIQWTPLIDATVCGSVFGGDPCTGGTAPAATTVNDMAWGTKFNVTPTGCAAYPTNACIIRYRIPVSANPANQPCGIRAGTYSAYEIVNPLFFTSASLAAAPTLTVA